MRGDGTIERVASFDNLWLAWRKASKGKRRRADVAAFGLRAESHLIELSRELLSGSWQPRILGATKRRFEKRRCRLLNLGDLRRLSIAVFAWYQFSREGNSEGLRRAYAHRRKT